MTEHNLLSELQRALTIAVAAIERRLDAPMTAPVTTDAGAPGRGAEAPKWEYTTWKVRSIWGQHAQILMADGEELAAEERPPLYATLARAGEDGWELVAFDSSEGAMILKRPRVEGSADARHVKRAGAPEPARMAQQSGREPGSPPLITTIRRVVTGQ